MSETKGLRQEAKHEAKQNKPDHAHVQFGV
jgi:hypothetical protein